MTVNNTEKLNSGYVKWFNSIRGFGMITCTECPDMDDQDIFFHYSSIMVKGYKSLPEDTEVTFELVRSESKDPRNNGLKAMNVRPTNLVNRD